MPKSYSIRHENIIIDVLLEEIKNLKPHEKTDNRLLTQIIQKLSTSQVVRDPIVIDRNTKVVLDGAHRFEAMRIIGCKMIPVASIDYCNEKILVDRWIKKIYLDDYKIETLIANYRDKIIFRKMFRNLNKLPYIDSDALFYKNILIVPKKEDQESFSFLLESLNKEIEKANCNVEYITEENLIMDSNRFNSTSILYFIPKKLTKEEVINNALKSKLFPPKTTRHIFPAKVYNVACPLEYCKKDDIEENKDKFYKLLLSKKLIKREPPCYIDETIVQHVCFIFE